MTYTELLNKIIATGLTTIEAKSGASYEISNGSFPLEIKDALDMGFEPYLAEDTNKVFYKLGNLILSPADKFDYAELLALPKEDQAAYAFDFAFMAKLKAGKIIKVSYLKKLK